MRVAIIILGVVGLLVLGYKWDSLHTDTNSVPKEDPILHSNDYHANPSLEKDTAPCPKCKKVKPIVQTQGDATYVFCKKHGDVAINL